MALTALSRPVTSSIATPIPCSCYSELIQKGAPGPNAALGPSGLKPLSGLQPSQPWAFYFGCTPHARSNALDLDSICLALLGSFGVRGLLSCSPALPGAFSPCSIQNQTPYFASGPGLICLKTPPLLVMWLPSHAQGFPLYLIAIFSFAAALCSKLGLLRSPLKVMGASDSMLH